MRGLYFIEDKYLQGLNLDNKIKIFIENLEKKYLEQIINEIFIANYDGKNVLPIYFLCAHKNCTHTQDIDSNKVEQIKQKKLEDFGFFIENILKKQCLINHEWILAKDQMWCLFDWMFRMDDYYIGITNSDKSLKELFENNVLSENDFINEIKQFYKDLLEK